MTINETIRLVVIPRLYLLSETLGVTISSIGIAVQLAVSTAGLPAVVSPPLNSAVSKAANCQTLRIVGSWKLRRVSAANLRTHESWGCASRAELVVAFVEAAW